MKVGSVQLIVTFLELMVVAMTFNGGEGAKYKDINYNDYILYGYRLSVWPHEVEP